MKAPETKHYLAYTLFTAAVGLLLLLNWLGIFSSVFGVDTAILLALFGGYQVYYHAISALFEKRLSADLAIVIAIGAALVVVVAVVVCLISLIDRVVMRGVVKGPRCSASPSPLNVS
jgi:hypothetical protein